MTMGRIRGRFLYARIQPTGLLLLPEPDPFNKWVFLGPNPAPLDPTSPAQPGHFKTQS